MADLTPDKFTGTCPMCGYKEFQTHDKFSNVMNHYINADNPKEQGVFNRDEDEFDTIPDKKGKSKHFIKKDVWLAKQAAPKPIVAPAKPTTPTK